MVVVVVVAARKSYAANCSLWCLLARFSYITPDDYACAFRLEREASL